VLLYLTEELVESESSEPKLIPLKITTGSSGVRKEQMVQYYWKQAVTPFFFIRITRDCITAPYLLSKEKYLGTSRVSSRMMTTVCCPGNRLPLMHEGVLMRVC